ncbi:hypothetical protein F5Y17DRAFT_439788 [Xylariaceae sp. FL0594]|nr:hypothetical protein F5Y17DRAFT_439788 [Xylariaceae sp. FL0594]
MRSAGRPSPPLPHFSSVVCLLSVLFCFLSRPFSLYCYPRLVSLIPISLATPSRSKVLSPRARFFTELWGKKKIKINKKYAACRPSLMLG